MFLERLAPPEDILPASLQVSYSRILLAVLIEVVGSAGALLW